MDINQLLAAIEALDVSKQLRQPIKTPASNSGGGLLGGLGGLAAKKNPLMMAGSILLDEIAGSRADSDRRKRENLAADQQKVAANAATYNYLTNAINNIRRR